MPYLQIDRRFINTTFAHTFWCRLFPLKLNDVNYYFTLFLLPCICLLMISPQGCFQAKIWIGDVCWFPFLQYLFLVLGHNQYLVVCNILSLKQRYIKLTSMWPNPIHSCIIKTELRYISLYVNSTDLVKAVFKIELYLAMYYSCKKTNTFNCHVIYMIYTIATEIPLGKVGRPKKQHQFFSNVNWI